MHGFICVQVKTLRTTLTELIVATDKQIAAAFEARLQADAAACTLEARAAAAAASAERLARNLTPASEAAGCAGLPGLAAVQKQEQRLRGMLQLVRDQVRFTLIALLVLGRAGQRSITIRKTCIYVVNPLAARWPCRAVQVH